MRPFLTAAAAIALAVGIFALGFPNALLESKGAIASPAAVVWVREVGVNIFALGVMALLVRSQPPSAALRAFCVGNAVVQFGLFPIEVHAFAQGTLTQPGGVVPNSVLHVVLGSTFAFFAWRQRGLR